MSSEIDWKKQKFHGEMMRNVQKFAKKHNIDNLQDAIVQYQRDVSDDNSNMMIGGSKKRTKTNRTGGGNCSFHKDPVECKLYKNECNLPNMVGGNEFFKNLKKKIFGPPDLSLSSKLPAADNHDMIKRTFVAKTITPGAWRYDYRNLETSDPRFVETFDKNLLEMIDRYVAKHPKAKVTMKQLNDTEKAYYLLDNYFNLK